MAITKTNQSTHVPVLKSARLLLRRHDEADLDAATAMWSSAEVVRHIGGRPFTRAEVWQRILRYVGHWAVRPFGYWAIVDKVSGVFLGEVGLANWKRDGFGSYLNEPECGWVLAPHAQRKGYASEALQTVLPWADEQLECATVCVIDPENSVSIRLARSVGYVPVDVDAADGIASTSLVFRRTAQVALAERV